MEYWRHTGMVLSTLGLLCVGGMCSGVRVTSCNTHVTPKGCGRWRLERLAELARDDECFVEWNRSGGEAQRAMRAMRDTATASRANLLCCSDAGCHPVFYAALGCSSRFARRRHFGR